MKYKSIFDEQIDFFDKYEQYKKEAAKMAAKTTKHYNMPKFPAEAIQKMMPSEKIITYNPVPSFAYPGFKWEHWTTQTNIKDPVEQKVLSVPYPHLNPNILHPPGLCAACDKFPGNQLQRKQSKHNFTGYYVKGKKKCPSEEKTTLDKLYENELNRPQ